MACDCSTKHPGILWPWASDGDDSREWVERCDDCQLYADDIAAAEALAAHLGRTSFGMARIHGDGSFAPFLPA